MNDTLFQTIVNETVDALKHLSVTDPSQISSCKSGEDFEVLVVKTVSEMLRTHSINPDATLDYAKGSHRFPDIIVELQGQKFGIEVKSSSSSTKKDWKINGNSILGSTKDDRVVETYIIYGKTAVNQMLFKARKYEDCITNVVVTHSPRYFIDMDATAQENFFTKSHINYTDLTKSENPIGLITDYFRRIGQKAWWLSESTPATVRFMNDLSDEEKNLLIGYGYAHFPEVLGRGSKKYKHYAIWLVTEKSVISSSLRDFFSSGGKQNLICEKASYKNLSKVFTELQNHSEYVILALDNSSPEQLSQDWKTHDIPEDTLPAKLNAWIKIASTHILSSPYPPSDILKNIFYKYLIP